MEIVDRNYQHNQFTQMYATLKVWGFQNITEQKGMIDKKDSLPMLQYLKNIEPGFPNPFHFGI